MAKISLLKIFLCVIFLFPLAVFSQTQNGNVIVVEKSKEKTLINGKVFYLHIVKKGENLYRISLAYNLTPKDIMVANPEILSSSSSVIKEGQVLKIPAEPNKTPNNQQIESDKFIYHIVEPGQTISTLTQLYKTSRETLIKFNPELEPAPVLETGQVVRIPKNQNIPAEEFIEYKVKRKDTMYSIAKKYEITVDDLIATNPALNTEDLQPGQILKIPVKSGNTNVNLPDRRDTITVITPLDTLPCDSAYTPFSATYNVAMLLPFCIDENQSLAMFDSVLFGKETSKQYIETNEVFQRTRNVLDFYQGALLALDSLKRAGLSLRLYTYDTGGRDSLILNKVINKPELTKMDLIIGPFFTEAVEKVSQFALKNQIKLIAPVSANSNILKNNPYVFQVIPNDTVNTDAIVNYIATIPNKNIVLISNSNPRDKGIIDLYRKKLLAISPTGYKEFLYKEYSNELFKSFVENVDNIVIAPSEDTKFMEDIFSLLTVAVKTYPIKVFGLSVCNMFDNLVRQDYFYNLEFHFPTSFYADYDNIRINNFLESFKKNYFIEPFYHTTKDYPYYFSKEGFNFAFLGYDVTFNFMSLLGKFGKNFENCIGSQHFNLLHSGFNFERLDSTSGFINKHVNILKYTKDYYIKKAN
jgi:LysM repeat protein